MADKRLVIEAIVKDEVTKAIKRMEGATDSFGKSAEKNLRNANRSTKAWLETAKGFVAAQLSITAVSKALISINALSKESIDLLRTQVNAEQGLATALGGVNQGLLDYASALQAKTTYGDEAIIQSMSSIAAFIKEEDQIRKLEKAILDFAAGTQSDLMGATNLVTKSVTTSTNALAEYGIKVEGAAGSTERIDSAVQGLSKHYEEWAEALAKTDIGRLDQTTAKLGDVKETLAEDVIPIYQRWEVIKVGLLKTTIKLIDKEIMFGRIVKAAISGEEAWSLLQTERLVNRLEKEENINALLLEQKERENELIRLYALQQKLKEQSGAKSVSAHQKEIDALHAELQLIYDAKEAIRGFTPPPPPPPPSPPPPPDDDGEQAKAIQRYWDMVYKETDDYYSRAAVLKKISLTQERALNEIRLAQKQEGQARELAVLAERHRQELEDFAGTQRAKNMMLERHEIEREQIEKRHRDKRIELARYEAEQKKMMAYSVAQSTMSATAQIIQATVKEGRARQSVLFALTIAQGMAASIAAFREAIKSAPGEIYSKMAQAFAVSAASIAAAVSAGARIKSQSFASGTYYAPGGSAMIGEQGSELVTTPTRGFLDRGSVVYNNRETKEILKGDTLYFNFAPGTDSTVADRIEDILLSAERDGRLENFKMALRQ